jgi:hypothetical protein
MRYILVIPFYTNAGGLLAIRANHHYIRNVEWGFELNNARVHLTALSGLHLALVLLADIDTLNNDALRFRNHPDYLATLAFVLASTADNFNRIAFANFNHLITPYLPYKTSGASDTIRI